MHQELISLEEQMMSKHFLGPNFYYPSNSFAMTQMWHAFKVAMKILETWDIWF